MDAFFQLAQGFADAVTPINLLFALIGTLLGTAVGVLPGIGPAMTVALLLPITYVLEPTGAFIMFAGIYYGGMYGGSTTSILLNTPGESSSIMTALEGNLMAQGGPWRGRAGHRGDRVAGTAGTIGTLLLALVAPVVVKLAVAIRPGRLLRARPAGLRRRVHGAGRLRFVGWRRSASGCSSGSSAPTC